MIRQGLTKALAHEGLLAATSALIGDAITYVGMATLLSALYARSANPERAYESLANAGAELARAMSDAAYAQEVMAPYMASLQTRLGDKVFETMQARYEEARRPS